MNICNLYNFQVRSSTVEIISGKQLGTFKNFTEAQLKRQILNNYWRQIFYCLLNNIYLITIGLIYLTDCMKHQSQSTTFFNEFISMT